MDNPIQDKSSNEMPGENQVVLSILSALLGGGALWFTWLRYTVIVNRPESYWYDWFQLAGIALVGILCASAMILMILGKHSGQQIFKTGLSIIPLLLFTNLVILLFRAIQSAIQGNTSFLFERLASQPQKLIIIPIVVIVLILLRSLSKTEHR
jgi:hypothetical protein